MLRLAAALLAAAAISTPQPQVLFAVINRGEDLAIEPVAMVTKTPGPCAGCWRLRFADVLGDHVETHPAFSARYYRHGRTYRVLTGGFDAGTATVDTEKSLGCVSLAATVRIKPPLPQYWPALAVGSLHVPPRNRDRLEVTAEEEKALSALARREFRKRGVPAALIAKTEDIDLISVDLNHDGQRDLIGSFQAADKEHEYRDHYQVLDEHRLFLIAMGDGAGGYRTDYVWYFDLKAGMNEARTATMSAIDTLDLDEDGTDEVITSTEYYEGNDYQILKRGRNGKWTKIYQGGGSGC